MRFCCRGVLQFVLVKPLVAIFDIALIASRNENHPVWLTIKMILYNISYAFALYCLFLFYLATKKLIKNFRPISKFATVKGKSLLNDYSLLCLNQVPRIFFILFLFSLYFMASIIFATYYQSMIIFIAAQDPRVGLTPESSLVWDNVLICLEMAVFAVCLVLAFPVNGTNMLPHILR